MEDSSQRKILELQKQASVLRMAFSAYVAILPGFSAGATLAYSATAQASLKDSKLTPLDQALTEEEVSWIVSILFMSTMISTFFSGIIADHIGRKKTLFIGEGFIILHWIMVFFAKNFPILFLARVIGGLGIGIIIPCGFLLLSEIALIRFRGLLGVLNVMTTNTAWCYCLILGSFATYDQLVLCYAAPAILFVFFGYLLPESPLWLVKHGEISSAKSALVHLRGKNDIYPVESELNELIVVVIKQNEQKSTFREKVQYLRKRSVWRPLCLMSALFGFQSLAGLDNITYYAHDIFSQADFGLSKYVMAILLQVVFTAGYFLSAPLLSSWGRRKQYLSASLMLALGMASTGTLILYGNLLHEGIMANVIKIAPPFIICITCISYSSGMGPVTVALVGEVFPARIKGLCCSVAVSFKYMFGFIGLKLFPAVVSRFGLAGTFYMNCAFVLLACLVALTFMPETQGLTLTELSKLYKDDCQDDRGEKKGHLGQGSDQEKPSQKKEKISMNV